MAVGFSTDVTFSVVPDDEARVALPVNADDSDARTWDATVLLDSQADFDLLEAYVSRADVLAAMGGGGLVVVKAGRGVRTLTIPLSNGAERAYHALLVSIAGRPRLPGDSHLVADVSFLVLGVAE